MDTCPTPLCDTTKTPTLTRCRVQFVRSVGYHGEVARQISYNTDAHDSTDYDPAWSPQGQYIYYVRNDAVIHRKGVPDYSTDTSDVAVIGDNTPRTYLAISPNGDSLAYCQQVGAHLQVFVASANGGFSRQLTSDNASYYYPKFSPDGGKLIVQRLAPGVGQYD